MEPTNLEIMEAFWRAAMLADTAELEKLLIEKVAQNPNFEPIATQVAKTAGALFAAVSNSAVALDEAITKFDKSAAAHAASLN